MDAELARLLRQGHGVVTSHDVSRPWLLPNAVRNGRLIRLFPSTYISSGDSSDPHVKRVAALRYLAGHGVLSHTTALAIWRVGWELQPQEPIHATVAAAKHVRGGKGLIIHRRRDFTRLRCVKRGGLLVVSLATAIIDSWPLLPIWERTGIVITAAAQRQVAVAELRQGLAQAPKLANAAELRRLLDLFEAGCQSPLELWGALHVFTGKGMPALRRQYRILAGGRVYYLDLFAEREKVNFELDGVTFHGGRAQRERDLRRDAALATLGILVVRFTYARLMSEPDVVRREALAILAARR